MEPKGIPCVWGPLWWGVASEDSTSDFPCFFFDKIVIVCASFNYKACPKLSQIVLIIEGCCKRGKQQGIQMRRLLKYSSVYHFDTNEQNGHFTHNFAYKQRGRSVIRK